MEMVVRRVEDQITYDKDRNRVKVTYPWTENVYKLTDNRRQAIRVQSSIERRLVKNEDQITAYNAEFKKFVD